MEVGDRVGAICGSCRETDVVEIFGYGVYEGRFNYDELPAGPIQEAVLGLKNPRILLDSGERVWGCECWWGPEAQVKKKLEGRTVVTITPQQARGDAGGEGQPPKKPCRPSGPMRREGRYRSQTETGRGQAFCGGEGAGGGRGAVGRAPCSREGLAPRGGLSFGVA